MGGVVIYLPFIWLSHVHILSAAGSTSCEAYGYKCHLPGQPSVTPGSSDKTLSATSILVSLVEPSTYWAHH